MTIEMCTEKPNTVCSYENCNEACLHYKKEYISPKYELQKQMTFMYDFLAAKSISQLCRQCSSCHGCR